MWVHGGSVRYLQQRQGIWSETVDVPVAQESEPRGIATNVDIAADYKGSLFLTWSAGDHVFLSEKLEGSDWSYPEIVSNSDKRSHDPQIVSDYQNSLHLAWVESPGRIMYRSRGSNGEWSLPIHLSGTDRRAASPLLAVDDNNGIYLAWKPIENPEDAVASIAISWKLQDNDSWSTSYFTYDGFASSITVDQTGAVHFLAREQKVNSGEPSLRYIIIALMLR